MSEKVYCKDCKFWLSDVVVGFDLYIGRACGFILNESAVNEPDEIKIKKEYIMYWQKQNKNNDCEHFKPTRRKQIKDYFRKISLFLQGKVKA